MMTGLMIVAEVNLSVQKGFWSQTIADDRQFYKSLVVESNRKL
jgi:hypothetical protein